MNGAQADVAAAASVTSSLVEHQLGRGARVALAGLLVAGIALAIAEPVTLILFVADAAVGALLIVRRPANAIGWITLAIAFGYIGTTVPMDLDVAALAAGTASTRNFLIGWVASWAGNASYVLNLALVMLFPTGDLPRGRWHWPAVAVIGTAAILTALAAIAPTFKPTLSGGVSTATIPNRLAVLPSLPIWSLIPTSNYMTLPVVVLRRCVQRTVDRRLDRACYEADLTVQTFTGRLREEIDLDAVSKQIVDTTRTDVRPTSVTVWLRGAGR